MPDKAKLNVALGITGEMCRQNALHCANTLQETDTPEEGAQLSAIGTMWATLGLLCIALGDPDK